tara:strand:+ start:2697 stop:2885 length:189 start_codon:yes stop_codon:yes gene_type:complete
MPTPSSNEKYRDAFIKKCMEDSNMGVEFPDAEQRAASCHSKWEKLKAAVELDFAEQIKRFKK